MGKSLGWLVFGILVILLVGVVVIKLVKLVAGMLLYIVIGALVIGGGIYLYRKARTSLSGRRQIGR
jgi:hypothetical protein